MEQYYYKANFEVYETNYKQGEGKFCNSWDDNGIIKAKNHEEVIKEIIEKRFYYTYKKEYLDYDDNYIGCSWLVDVENQELSKEEIKQFKKGKKAFSSYMHLKIYKLQEVNLDS